MMPLNVASISSPGWVSAGGSRVAAELAAPRATLRVPASICRAPCWACRPDRGRPAAELEQTLRHVAEDTTRLVRLTDQLLELERATAGQPSVAAAGADLAAAVQRAARRATYALTGTGRQVHLGPGAQVQVDASPEQLDLVLGNVVDNAIIHGAGSVQIAASLSGSAVRVIVQDDGAGLDAAFVPHATERFRRADAARSTPGNGLGLAVVHTVLAGVGGDLWLCSHSTHHRYPPAQHAQVNCGHGPSQPSCTVLTAVLPLTSPKPRAWRRPPPLCKRTADNSALGWKDGRRVEAA